MLLHVHDVVLLPAAAAAAGLQFALVLDIPNIQPLDACNTAFGLKNWLYSSASCMTISKAGTLRAFLHGLAPKDTCC